MLDITKTFFSATVNEYCPEDILNRYPKDTIVWRGPSVYLESEWAKRYGKSIAQESPVKRSKFFGLSSVEFLGNKVAVLAIATKTAEIRENKVPF